MVFLFTGGYQNTPFRVGDKGHCELGGFDDATFRLMAILDGHGVTRADHPNPSQGPTIVV